jgi:uncharacterized membrane protein YgaE (UPF0421/DUF939 family)
VRTPTGYRARVEAWASEGSSRVRHGAGPILQTAVATGLAWEICVRGLDHRRPIFAAIVAIVAMGFSAGRRGRAALLLVIGVATGIVIGDVLVRALDRGGIQITVVVFVAMTLTLFLTREPIVVIQAGISAALVVAVDRQASGLAPDRLEDALVGAAVAGVISVVLFPIDPVASLVRRARPIFATLDRSLAESAAALRENRLDRAELARALRTDERTLAEAVDVAREATWIAPRRRGQRDRVDEIADASLHLGAIVRGARTIAGAAHRVVREGAAPRADLADAVDLLRGALRSLGRWIETGEDMLRDTTRRDAGWALGAAADLPTTGIGQGTIAHVVGTLAAEAIRATGIHDTLGPGPARRAPVEGAQGSVQR